MILHWLFHEWLFQLNSYCILADLMDADEDNEQAPMEALECWPPGAKIPYHCCSISSHTWQRAELWSSNYSQLKHEPRNHRESGASTIFQTQKISSSQPGRQCCHSSWVIPGSAQPNTTPQRVKNRRVNSPIGLIRKPASERHIISRDRQAHTLQ